MTTFTAHHGQVCYHTAPITPAAVAQLLKLFDAEGLQCKAAELRMAREDAAFQRLRGWAREGQAA